MSWLTAIPVYNEERHLLSVLAQVRRYSPNILIVNDGSTYLYGGVFCEGVRYEAKVTMPVGH